MPNIDHQKVLYCKVETHCLYFVKEDVAFWFRFFTVEGLFVYWIKIVKLLSNVLQYCTANGLVWSFLFCWKRNGSIPATQKCWPVVMSISLNMSHSQSVVIKFLFWVEIILMGIMMIAIMSHVFDFRIYFRTTFHLKWHRYMLLNLMAIESDCYQIHWRHRNMR